MSALEDVIGRLAAVRVVPLATLDADNATAVGAALIRAGLPCVEIAFRNPTATEAIAAARAVDGLLVGAGTILSEEQVEAASQAGAHFAVAPGTSDRVLECAARLGLPFFPGVATPTEIEHARDRGLRILKAFPVSSLGGPAFLRAIGAAYPDVRFIPTGGIDGVGVRDYLALPNVLACAGSWLVSPALVQQQEFGEIERRAREIRTAIG